VLEDDRVDVVHVTTPNVLHFEQVRASLAAGKHVICEKPLATNSLESAELLRLAEASRLVHCTNFNLRFYPQVEEARHLVLSGAIGEVRSVHGSYLQDWLLTPTDWNWRVDPAEGGELRAVADIGFHWFDLVQHVVGRRVSSVQADLATTVPVRYRPARGEPTSCSHKGSGEPVKVESEDFANVLFRLESGAPGVVTLSQVSAGRANSLELRIDGSKGALGWSSERAEELWVGHRHRSNEVIWRDPSRPGQRSDSLPAGHGEGFRDTFRALYRAVYEEVGRARRGEDRDVRPRFPTFVDGHAQQLIGDAISRSNLEQGWQEVLT
jgi:predicted dehydrogenase